MFFHRRKSLDRAVAVELDHQTLRKVVCCCEFLRQYMYFLRTLSHLSWLQWNLDDSKLSLTSRIFRTTVSFFSAQFRHKVFFSKVNTRHWIYISFPVINSTFKRALFFFWPPDIVNFRLKSLFVITLVQSSRNVHTFDCFGRNGPIYFPPFNFQMSSDQLPVFWRETQMKTLQARQVDLSRLSSYPEIHEVDLWQV